MNQYLKNLNKIEFVVTNACTGKCKHCSEGDHTACTATIDPRIAADAVRKVAAVYPIETVMAFGGEPLLYPEAVYAVIQAAAEVNVPRRQVITNGYFTVNEARMVEVAARLADCGVNDLLLSVDAFHQETIPLDAVMRFAAAAGQVGIPMRLQPAWLVSADDDNPYNLETRRVLGAFADMAIPVGEGNVVFFEGNARRYLAEYEAAARSENPYREDSCDVRCLSFSANGDVLGGNVYREDIMEVIKNYTPGDAL